MKMGMKRGVLAACGVVVGLAGAMRPADATLTSFTFGGFADGATVSVSFTGTDLNVDGVFSNVPGVGVAGEITGLSISFSGDSLIPAFVVSNPSTDFVIYVNQVGLTPTADGLPVATAGDGVVDVGGSNQPSSTLLGTFTLIGGACSAFGGNRVILPAGQCADLTYTPYVSGSPTTAVQEIVPIPEPISLAVFGTALAGLAAVRRRSA